MGAIFEKCALCPKTAPTVRTYGPVALPKGGEGMVCHHHLHHPEDVVERSIELPKDNQRKLEKLSLTAWYNLKLNNAPERCEETGEILVIPSVNPRTVVCHIVPKARVKSVSTDENNFFYANADPHNLYDKNYKSTAKNMNVAKVCIQRFATFMHKIPANEMKYVAQWLIDGANKLKKKK